MDAFLSSIESFFSLCALFLSFLFVVRLLHRSALFLPHAHSVHTRTFTHAHQHAHFFLPTPTSARPHSLALAHTPILVLSLSQKSIHPPTYPSTHSYLRALLAADADTLDAGDLDPLGIVDARAMRAKKEDREFAAARRNRSRNHTQSQARTLCFGGCLDVRVRIRIRIRIKMYTLLRSLVSNPFT